MERTVVQAHDRNERSRHEPSIHTGALSNHALFRGKARRGHVCSASCSHGMSPQERKSQSLTTYAGPRPWVIEHAQGATVG